MKKITLLSAASICALLFTSCSENKGQFDGYTKAENGLYYKFFNHAESGAKPQIGDAVMLRYQFMLQRNDSVIMDSKDASRDGTGYTEIGIQRSTFVGSLEDGLLMMTKGDSASFIVPADSFFLKTMGQNQLPKFVNKGEYLKAVIKMGPVRTKQQIEEEQKKQMAEREAMIQKAQGEEAPAREKYLADNKIKAKPLASGLYFIETKKGTGANPKATDLVTVHYTGKLLDGKVFDSSVERGTPVEFLLNQVIPGWTEGLQLMKKGGKAQLIIPSNIAYGPNGTGPIPPYSTLVFDVELIDFKDAPAGGPAMPGQPH